LIYIDTSALVPIFILEPKSAAVVDWLESSNERLAISDWSLVEFASAAAIKVRMREIGAALAKQATTKMESFAQNHCTIAMPGRDQFRHAAELASDGTLKLRAGDALHLAIAQKLNAQGILCLDDAMIDGARLLGMNVVTL
jgi:predicted nucleic acid-binding protein